jgi:hypothetical protein
MEDNARTPRAEGGTDAEAIHNSLDFENDVIEIML